MTKLANITKQAWFFVMIACPICFFFNAIGFDNLGLGVFLAVMPIAMGAVIGTLALGVCTLVTATAD
jgi:hypothetical protein